jgi:Kef-type K+ transport system membrane component KefB/Trk K+ transport system NAD-binding subunit
MTEGNQRIERRGIAALAVRLGLALAALVAAATPSFAAGGPLPPLVHDIGMGLFLSGFLAILFARIKFPAIAGYILAGIVAGPLGLKLVTDPANIDTIAQLGFVLLLFVIGLEMDIGKIAKSGRTILVTGAFQYPLMVVFGLLMANLVALVGLGPLLGGGLGPLYVGLVIACSSTLLVVKLFQEAFELDTVPGRIALGLLVIEDVWAIIVIVLQPNLQHPEFLPIAESFVGIAILGGIAFLTAKTLIPIAFRWIAKVPEIILVGAIAWCFAIVFIGASFDWLIDVTTGYHHTHLAVGAGMGALIAGATIASLPYSTEIVTKVSVVKDFFVTLFFVGLGLSIPEPSGPAVLILAVAIAIIAIVARQLIVFPLLYFTGLDLRNAEVTAVRMAQISEFSLVIAFLGADLGHLSRDLSSAMIFAFVITALTTAPLYHNAYRIHALVAPLLRRIGFKDPPSEAAAEEREWRLALLGFHRVASSLLHDIARDDPDLVRETLVVDFNVALHERIRAVGAHVEYGDLSNPDTLHHAGIDRARIVVSTVADDLLRGTDNRRIVEAVRKINPKAIIIANSVTLAEVEAIYAAGADYVFLSRVDTARALAEAIGNALSGSLAMFRASQEEIGKPQNRREVLS